MCTVHLSSQLTKIKLKLKIELKIKLPLHQANFKKIGFHPVRLARPFRCQVRTVESRDRQTDGRTDRHVPSFHNASPYTEVWT